MQRVLVLLCAARLSSQASHGWAALLLRSSEEKVMLLRLGKYSRQAEYQEPIAPANPTLDRLTAAMAVALSQRALVTRALAITAAAMGMRLLEVLPVAAAACQICKGPCGNCSSGTGTCCSPNGQWCAQCDCTCEPGCGPCGQFRACYLICDDGSRNCSCIGCTSSCHGI